MTDGMTNIAKIGLNALNESEREEYQRLRTQREHVEGVEQERILGRLRTLSRMTDVFDSNQVDNLPSFDEYPVSDEANEKVGAGLEELHQRFNIPAIRLRSAHACSFPSRCL